MVGDIFAYIDFILNIPTINLLDILDIGTEKRGGYLYSCLLLNI